MSNHAIVIQLSWRHGYITVKVKAVALNPTDILHIDYFASPGARQVGSLVTKRLKKGDRVAGFAHGSNALHHEDGTFAEYITAKGDLLFLVPNNVTFEEAVTLGISITTVRQALYQSLGLPTPAAPAREKFSVLIYGGSTATGALAIRFAKLSGLEVITTVSPKHFDYVKVLSADVAFDYSSETVVRDIKCATGGRLKYAFDCISKEPRAKISVGAFGDDGGIYTTLLPIPAELVSSINDKVTPKFTLAYSSIGEAFEVGQSIPANPDDFTFAKTFWVLTEKLLGEGKIKFMNPGLIMAAGA
ncbi:uncharacterized protein NECHADRAFT_98217 [Fusarium vanettenii 77-13-4]|uniref:Enoyl reductase (ER) domain-containing protein n=1 Tax=Fusarium vanettenii (strain ATCC MYA-4622 / CBS 123669 / FGSC 9596 / NRRL 45880 / 77-13-4) TaxID=660122 RepID=C7ZKF2_FUSV7|nr:uncharacterized protein NECHADRAFT_98217 [Fusarium vanettenii 77-13-4]EEU35549.1 hypothetical protein NECHADRAFT_98217 [Fusarium vanettenii 77-13-4]